MADRFALAGIGVAVIVFGGPTELHAALRDVIQQALDRLHFQPGNVDESEIADALALVVPGIIAASWMVMAVINATLAQGLLARFKLNWRPSPDIALVDLPLWIPLALAVATTLTMLGDVARFFGVNAIVTLTVPFCLAGLGVVHALILGGSRTHALSSSCFTCWPDCSAGRFWSPPRWASSSPGLG